MENKTAYADWLMDKTAAQLIDLFNKEVGQTHWVSARGRHLSALRQAFRHHGIDCSEVLNSSGGFNLAKGNEVFLKKGVLYLLSDN